MCIWSKSKSSLSISPSINLSIYLSIYLSIFLFIYLSIYPSIFLFNDQTITYIPLWKICVLGRNRNTLYLFLAHRSRRLTGELIGYPWIRRPSVRRRPSTFSNIFSSETAWPIKSKFYVEPPW